MYAIIVLCFSLLSCSRLVLSSALQRRQTQLSSALSVPTFVYGYYSQVYPNGEGTTSGVSKSQNAAAPSITAPTNSSSTTRPSSLSPLGAGSGPGGQNFGPVGVNEEEAFVASMCQPINKTDQPDMNFPCNKLLLYGAPCVYGQSYETFLKTGAGDGVTLPLLSPNDQLKCFCTQGGPGHAYWQNSE